MNKHTDRYRKIRGVLKQLVTNMPSGPDRPRPDTALQTAHTYLHDHCAECGATLERHDYALVHAQEMVRIGTSVASDIADMPICPECYMLRCAVRQRFAPVAAPEHG